MQVRRRSGDMTQVVGKAAKNTVTSRKDGPTQVRPIRNAVSTPRATSVGKIRNTVSG